MDVEVGRYSTIKNHIKKAMLAERREKPFFLVQHIFKL